MNRNNISFIFIVSSIFSIEIFWDLGVGITEFASILPHKLFKLNIPQIRRNKEILSNGLYYGIISFEKINTEDASALYEYVDCYYSLGHYAKALNILESFDETQLTDNILFLKSKIFLKLDLYNESKLFALY